jgi:hypothetical protein
VRWNFRGAPNLLGWLVMGSACALILIATDDFGTLDYLTKVFSSCEVVGEKA